MNETLDRWIQRGSLAALFAVALALLTVGVALYGPASEAQATPPPAAADAAP